MGTGENGIGLLYKLNGHKFGGIGVKTCTQVRKLFAAHGKTNNKRYAVGHNGAVDATDFSGLAPARQATAVKRNQSADKLKRENQNGTDLGFAAYLYNLLKNSSDVTKGGNCGEQSKVAAYVAVTEHNVPQGKVYLASVQDPADHVFCVLQSPDVALSPLFKSGGGFKFPSLKAGCESGLASHLLAVDPWLNVVCTFDAYLTLAEARFKDWTARGKRIAWHASYKDSTGATHTVAKGGGWYPPLGDYSKSMAESRVVFGEFR